MAIASVGKAGAQAPVSERQNIGPTFNGVLAPFKEKVFALDNAEVARAVLEGLGKLTGAMAVDPTDGMRYYFNGLALPEELIESLEQLDGYVKQQTSHIAIEQLKKGVKAFEREFTSHVQEMFKSCEELLALGERLEASGNKQAAAHAFYAASLKALEGSELDKLEIAATKIKELDPTMASLDLQQRVNLKAQMTIISLKRELAPLKEAEEARLRAIGEEYGFGPANWAKYFGDVGEVAPLPFKIEEILAGPCPYWEGKRVRDTHMLVLVPVTVNGEPFTLNSLEKMIKEPKEGHATKYKIYWEKAKEEVGARAPEQSYWALMTKDVLPGSRDKTYQEQLPLLKGSHRPPKMLEAATAILMHHVRTGERRYSNNPWTYTRCEEVAIGWRLAVGGLQPGGLYFLLNDYVFRNGNLGLGGVRKFL